MKGQELRDYEATIIDSMRNFDVEFHAEAYMLRAIVYWLMIIAKKEEEK